LVPGSVNLLIEARRYDTRDNYCDDSENPGNQRLGIKVPTTKARG